MFLFTVIFVSLAEKNLNMSFWTKEENKRLVRRFCDTYACLPVERTKLRENHADIIKKLFERLKSRGLCNRIDFTGSAYTGLEIGPDREFDIQFVSNGKGLKMQQNSNYGDTFYIEATSGYDQHKDCVTKQYILSAHIIILSAYMYIIFKIYLIQN